MKRRERGGGRRRGGGGRVGKRGGMRRVGGIFWGFEVDEGFSEVFKLSERVEGGLEDECGEWWKNSLAWSDVKYLVN